MRTIYTIETLHYIFIYDVSFEIPNTNFYDDSIMMNYVCTRNSNSIVF